MIFAIKFLVANRLTISKQNLMKTDNTVVSLEQKYTGTPERCGGGGRWGLLNSTFIILFVCFSVDAVLIVSPTSTHEALITSSLEAGKAVACTLKRRLMSKIFM